MCVFAGVCLGLQLAVIEFARNILGWKDAQSTEFDKSTTHPMVHTIVLLSAITHKPPSLSISYGR